MGREALAPKSVIARSIDRRIPRSIAESGPSPLTPARSRSWLYGAHRAGNQASAAAPWPSPARPSAPRVRQVGLPKHQGPQSVRSEHRLRDPATPPRPPPETNWPIYDTTVPNCVRLRRRLQSLVDAGRRVLTSVRRAWRLTEGADSRCRCGRGVRGTPAAPAENLAAAGPRSSPRRPNRGEQGRVAHVAAWQPSPR